MNDIKLNKVLDITGTVLAGVLLTVSLENLVPEGMWLYLFYLVVGTVIITNKINRVIRGE
jgi:uncharacterized membrane protein YeaQ/YmgE (transglycosylase-associated protein family)